MHNSELNESEKSELVWGARRIGQEIGRSPRQAFYLLEQGLIPGRKIGRIWVSTRKELHMIAKGAS